MADETTGKKDLSAKVQKLVDAVKELSLMEVSELVGALEDEFGVFTRRLATEASVAPPGPTRTPVLPEHDVPRQRAAG